MRAPLLTIGLAALCGCGYGFEDDNARFDCKNNGDCAGDDVCGGHALVGTGAVSYCVAPDQLVAAIGLRIPNPVFSGCQPFDPSSSGPASWGAVVTVTPDGGTGTPYSYAPGTSESCDGLDQAERGKRHCCIGGPDHENEEGHFDGRASVLCYFEHANKTNAVLQVRYTNPGGGDAGTATHSGTIVEGEAPLLWAQGVEWNSAGTSWPICP